MTITQRLLGTKGFFIATVDEKEAGVMSYTQAGSDLFIIDHTEVHEGFEGKGVGKKLVLAAVAHAREKGMRIMPLCTFAKSVFDRTPELQDVLFRPDA